MSNRALWALLTLGLAAAPGGAAEKRGEWTVAACRKACIPPHDAKVIACKTLRSNDRGCVAEAAAERKACEAACRKPRPKKK